LRPLHDPSIGLHRAWPQIRRGHQVLQLENLPVNPRRGGHQRFRAQNDHHQESCPCQTEPTGSFRAWELNLPGQNQGRVFSSTIV